MEIQLKKKMLTESRMKGSIWHCLIYITWHLQSNFCKSKILISWCDFKFLSVLFFFIQGSYVKVMNEIKYRTREWLVVSFFARSNLCTADNSIGGGGGTAADWIWPESRGQHVDNHLHIPRVTWQHASDKNNTIAHLQYELASYSIPRWIHVGTTC